MAASFDHVLGAGQPLTANHLARCSKRRRKSFARGKGGRLEDLHFCRGRAVCMKGKPESPVSKPRKLTPTRLTSRAPPGAENPRPWALPDARRDTSGAPRCAAEHAGKGTSPDFLALTSRAFLSSTLESRALGSEHGGLSSCGSVTGYNRHFQSPSPRLFDLRGLGKRLTASFKEHAFS